MPCDGCVNLPRCRERPVCCEAFYSYTRSRGCVDRWQGAARTPTLKLYLKTYATSRGETRAVMAARRARVATWTGTDKALGRLYGVSGTTIAKDRRALGKPTTYNGGRPIAERRAAVAAWTGTDRALAARFGCTSATIGNDRKALGIATKFLGGARNRGRTATLTASAQSINLSSFNSDSRSRFGSDVGVHVQGEGT